MAAVASGLVITAASAHATIAQHCESWKGGSEVRCEARKTEGNTKEIFTFHYSSSAPKTLHFEISEWWSHCGGAGLIKDFRSAIADMRNFQIENYLTMKNECYEIFFYGCHTAGDYVPCTQYLLTTPAIK